MIETEYEPGRPRLVVLGQAAAGPPAMRQPLRRMSPPACPRCGASRRGLCDNYAVEAQSGRSTPPRTGTRVAAGSEAQQPTGTARRRPPPPGTPICLERRRTVPRGQALRWFYGRVRGASSGSGPGLIRQLSGAAQSRTADWGNPAAAAISSVVCPARAAARTASTSPARACSSSAARWRQRFSSGLSGLWFSPMWGSMARSPASAGAARLSDDRGLADDRARPGTPTARTGQPAIILSEGLWGQRQRGWRGAPRGDAGAGSADFDPAIACAVAVDETACPAELVPGAS